MSEKQRENTSQENGASGASGATDDKRVMVSPVQVLLGAVDLATTRGAFRIAELQLITQAYGMLTQKPPTEEGAGAASEQPKESSIPELERAIQNVVKNN